MKTVESASYITGDTHIPIDIAKVMDDDFCCYEPLTLNDYVIICGDFGGVWDKSSAMQAYLQKLNSRGFTTLFVDGNHENFDMLNAMPVETWQGVLPPDRDNSPAYDWMRFINTDSKEVFEMLSKNNKAIGTAYEELQRLSLDSSNRELYEARLKALRDETSRVNSAERRAKREVAFRMLNKGMSIDDVMELTELPKSEIEKLKQ